MLRFVTNPGDCTRREFITAGALGLGGLSLASLLQARAGAAQGNAGKSVKDKAVVLLFLAGGASHIETFNPNMDAPAPYSSILGSCATSIPGVHFGATFPLLAQRAKQLAVVRSFRHPVGDHDKAITHVLTGGTIGADAAPGAGASMGSMYARLRGTNDSSSGLSTYALLSAAEVDPQYRVERERVARGSAPGGLGMAYAPFDPAGGGTFLKNMELNIGRERFDDRRRLLTSLDRMREQVDASDSLAGADRFTQQAYDVILGSAADAFDLRQEDPALRERYDTSQFKIGHKTFRPSTLGQQMLLARRMVEAGCGFVTVQAAGWDMHADGNNPGIVKGMNMLGPPVDKAVSAFLDDLATRGLSEKVLLVITGDFGRTPRVNKSGGRDHWANLCTLALAGGGLKMGQVIGQSARQNDVPASDPIALGDLLATVLHTLFDVGELRVERDVPRDLLSLVENGKPIAGL